MKKILKYILVIAVTIVIVVMINFIANSLTKNHNDGSNDVTKIEGNNNANIVDDNKLSGITEKYGNHNDIVLNEEEVQRANQAIRESLKDSEWIKQNIYGGYYKYYTKETTKITFVKLANINGMPAYLVDVCDLSAGGNRVTLVTYKDGNVICGKSQLEMEYSNVWADVDKNIVMIGHGFDNEIYEISDTDFKVIMQAKYDRSETRGLNEYVYFYDGVECTEEEYSSYLEEFQKNFNFINIDAATAEDDAVIELTDENIDKYVK